MQMRSIPASKAISLNRLVKVSTVSSLQGHLMLDCIYLPMDLYFAIKQQRKGILAPVDTMGSATFKDGPKRLDQTDLIRFRILISLLLSSQTKDEVTFIAVNNLERFLVPLSPQNVLLARESDLHKCIEKVGYHNKKLTYLIEISKKVLGFNDSSSKKILLEKSDIGSCSIALPSSLEECLKLPGIGKKMAFLYLQHGFGYSLGIGVDTHVHRIANKIGLVSSKTPEQTRIQLEQKFDRSEWESINTVLVGFGQTVCTKSHPKCNKCTLGTSCPGYDF